MAYPGAQISSSRADLSGGNARISSQIDQYWELGVLRFFGSTDLDRMGLVSGWAEPEEAHNWNDGCEAVLSVLVNDSGKNGCVIEFTGEPFLEAQCPRQDVILHVNGFQVGRWRLSTPGQCVLSAKIEPEQMFRRGGGFLLRCAWTLPDSISPAVMSMGNDTRKLGFCFRSITITQG